MKLLVADEPFYTYPLEPTEDMSLPAITRTELRVRVALTDLSETAPPPLSSARDFVIDTAADLVTAYFADLDAADLSLDPLIGIEQPVILWDGSLADAHLQAISVWVFSNQQALLDQPYRIDLLGGVLVFPDPDPEYAHFTRPLLGMNAFLDGGLRLLMDGQTRKFSLWIPD